jgi:glutamate formiminotransferase / 5-formyltetrahydrofolate cyclo-ligase
VLECVVNVSEGRDPEVLAALAEASGRQLLDVHTDAGHNRSVLTLAARDSDALETAVRDLAREVLARLDLGRHVGVHPRFGVLDVVPFVPIPPGGAQAGEGEDREGEAGGMGEAMAARDRFARWAGEVLELPCFLYGPDRDLPTVRRQAFRTLAPATGPAAPHPSAGACAVGARGVMLAWNLWLADRDREAAALVAAALRGPAVRALAFELPAGVQLSFNLVDPLRVGPATVFDAASAAGARVVRSELVGLAPAALLERTEPARWAELDLHPDRTIEARLEQSGG